MKATGERAKQLGLERAVVANARAARGGRRATREEARAEREQLAAAKGRFRDRWRAVPSREGGRVKRVVPLWQQKGHKKPGRKPAGERAGERHEVRPFLESKHPVHVTLRVSPEVGRLRRRSAYHAFKWALVSAVRRHDFRVVHISIQAHHVHLICEAFDRVALGKGVRGLSISAAHRLNRAIGEDTGTPRRKGRVFVDRYHAERLDTPRKCRSALAYVLNNWRRHREDLGGVRQRRAKVDPYSSGVVFPGWADIEGPFPAVPGYELLPVSFPKTWLLTKGWKRWGWIKFHERPGPEP